MKKTLTFIAAFLFLALNAQEKRIDFNKELKYSFVGGKEKTTDISFKSLGNTSGEFLTQASFNMFPINMFSDNLGLSTVNIGLNNKLSNSSAGMMMFGHGSAFSDGKTYDAEIKKLNTKETILGLSCSHYLITYSKSYDEHNYQVEDAVDDGKETLKVCLDDKNSLNNIPVLTGILGQFGRKKIALGSMKGLVMKIAPEEEYSKDYMVLSSMKESKDFVYFDHRSAMMKQQKMMDSIALQRQKWESEYAVDTAAVYADSAEAAIVDSVAAANWDDYYDELPKYESTWKKAPEETSYAIESVNTEKLWDGIPKHCRNLDKDLPQLSNKEFEGHLRNLSGQMCDMYLTQSSQHTVAVKMTLDDIRREYLYINKNKGKLNKSDQRKVDRYLENLD